MNIKNIIYALLLGVGMAACLSQNDNDNDAATEVEEAGDTAATSASAGTAPDPAAFVIEKGRAGDIKVGMPIEDVRKRVTTTVAVKDTTLTLEGQQSTAYLLRAQGQEKGLLVEQLCEPDCKVWRISTESEDYKTPKGIGVGSKYHEVKQAYPISTVSLAEGNLVAVSEEAGMSFVLEDTALPQDGNKKGKYNPANIPANTIVKRIMLY
jgi:hypothetical protein